MRFLLDAQLPPRLALLFKGHGHEASHVVDHAAVSADDSEIWRLASELNAVIVTKDEDFVSLAAIRAAGPPIVWIRIGNCSNRALEAWFEPLLEQVVAQIQAGARVVELI